MFFSSRNVDKIATCKQNEDAADFFDDVRSLRLFVPIHISLDEAGGGAGKDDNGAVAEAIKYKQKNTVNDVRCSELECNGEHRGHICESAGAKRDAEDQPDDKGGE